MRGRHKKAQPRKTGRKPRQEQIRKEDVLKSIKRTNGRTANLQELLREFDVTPKARHQLKGILTQLVKDGHVQRPKGSRFEAAARPLLEGTILLHRDGYGFVVPAQKVSGIDSDIFIPPSLTGSAMNGDRVQVEITNRKPGGRAEGRVTSIVKRSRSTVVGQLRFDGRTFFVVPTDEKLPAKILILEDAAENKDKIVEVEITQFPTADSWPIGKIVSVIGFLDDANVETQIVIKKFGLPTAFPKEVEAEAAKLPDVIAESDLVGRDDFRKRSTITIDPATARDFDDAIDVEALPDGGFELGVHIADVAHFVRTGSIMDTEARIRGTSVYFPDRVIPMLPENVSNHLCSLNPKTDRLAMSVVMQITREGDVRDYSLHNSVIHSKERMNYDDVQKILDGDEPTKERYAHILAEIQKIDRLARLLQRRRHESGAIDFDLPEPILAYDDQGNVSGIVKSVRHFSHRIIEEFMVLANEVVARHLEHLKIPAIYRVHEEPDPAKVATFSETVGTFGFKFRPKRVRPAEFQKFIASIQGRPEERMLSYLMLRSFKQAVYSPHNIGHFGLASNAYTHFTSPIRRYPDLVVHRILKSAIARRETPEFTEGQLEAMASESSERERQAAQAEREILEWKKILWMERHLGDTYEAIVLSVWKDGFNVELIDQFIEGFVSVVDLPGGEYRFDPDDRALTSRGTKRRFRLGNRMTVEVTRVDKLLRRVYFRPVLEGRKGRKLRTV